MKNIFEKGKKVVDDATNRLNDEITSGMKMFKEVVNGLPILMSVERLQKTEQQYDEKHYFVGPYCLSETGVSLHTMRSLPVNAPEINDLPKRRIFHFPNEHYEATLREHMLNSARDIARHQNSEQVSSLQKLADDIDALDTKLTYGMLIVGGIAAVFNPIVGAGIAAKAVLPGVSGLLVKYGLRPAGEKLTKSQLEKHVTEAEKKVLHQFSESSTLKVINPILQALELALRTNKDQHYPLMDPNLASGSIPELSNEDWRKLTETAVFHVYNDTITDPSKHAAAKLGPEDIRWLQSMFINLDN